MIGLLLLLLVTWAIMMIGLVLHYHAPRIGFAPLLIGMGGMVAILQGYGNVSIYPYPGLTLFFVSNSLVPIVLATVLIVYVANGGVPARMLIYGIIGVSALVISVNAAGQLLLITPIAGSDFGIELSLLLEQLELRGFLASLTAFVVDMFMIAIVYQGVRNAFRRVPEWLILGLALLISLWTDSIVFRTLAFFGTPNFGEVITSDLFGKTLSALILWPLLAFYMQHYAPRDPQHLGGRNRRTLDLLFGSFQDIKLALVRTTTELEESRAEREKDAIYFAQIAENITEALWLATPDQSHTFYVNNAYEQMIGRRVAGIYTAPLPFLESALPEDRARVLADLYLPLTTPFVAEYRIRRDDGQIRWVRDRAAPIRNTMGDVYRIAGITEDITARREREQEQIAFAIEREKMKVLQDFIVEASHDLKSPLAAIQLRASMLPRYTDPARITASSKEIIGLTNRVSNMIDDLLTLARLENTEALSRQSLTIREWIDESGSGARALAEQKGLIYTLSSPDDTVTLLAEVNDLTRALANLIDNAVHYTRTGGRVEIEAVIEGDELIVRVRDNGIGIPADEIPRLFNRFFRAANAPGEDPTGTGLGLAIVKKVIDRHGGRISIESTLGAGSTFTLTLPLIVES